MGTVTWLKGHVDTSEFDFGSDSSCESSNSSTLLEEYSVFWRGGGESPMGRELCASDIWAIASETGNNFFAWLHQEEFELLGRHERYLQSVLSTVQFDAESAVVGSST